MYLGKGIEIKGLWFNPNIHPYTEYQRRLDSVQRLQKLWNFDVEYVDEYPLDDFLKSVVNQGENRCVICYTLRLDKTAELAKKKNLRFFTTSLLASPYQKFDMIVRLGEEIGARRGIEFYWEDLRQGWQISRDTSKEFGLHRQKYCGCIYSEMERYLKKKKIAKL
jgi:predicted adenine nucleotide alpha hydrolase (AANH) superfamily ATPase